MEILNNYVGFNFIEEAGPRDKARHVDDIIRNQQQFTQAQQGRAFMEQLHKQFRVMGNSFYFKDTSNLAFMDQGKRIVSQLNDDRAAQAMVTMAQAKGWQTIKVSGHQDFQRKVWIEASTRGIDVYGYMPTEQELIQLNINTKHRQTNTVEETSRSLNDDEITYSANKINQNTQRESSVTSLANPFRKQTFKSDKYMTSLGSIHQSEQSETAHQNKISDMASSQGTEQTVERIYTGRILNHGHDNYNFDKNNSPSYYIRLATDKGEKEVWGIDLNRAVSEESAQTGDYVTLKFLGSKDVKVESPIKDEAGNIVDTQWIETKRNTWEVSKLDRAKVIDAVAATFIDTNVKDTHLRDVLKEAVDARLLERQAADQIPQVSIYDKNAAAKKPDQNHDDRVAFEPAIERTRA